MNKYLNQNIDQVTDRILRKNDVVMSCYSKTVLRRI